MLVLLFWGAKRLPEIARVLGKITTEFKKAKNEALYSNSNRDVLQTQPEIEKQLPNARANKDGKFNFLLLSQFFLFVTTSKWEDSWTKKMNIADNVVVMLGN